MNNENIRIITKSDSIRYYNAEYSMLYLFSNSLSCEVAMELSYA